LKEVSKNHDKISARRYLLEIPFVPRKDNGPLEVKESSHFKYTNLCATMGITFLVIPL